MHPPADARARGRRGVAEARERLTQAERALQDARREAARVGAELAAANQFLRGHAGVRRRWPGRPASLSEHLRVGDGYELALAAALGGRLDAALVDDVAGAEALLDRAGPDGGTALLAAGGVRAGADLPEAARDRQAPAAGAAAAARTSLSGPQDVLELAERLLADAWVVERPGGSAARLRRGRA